MSNWRNCIHARGRSIRWTSEDEPNRMQRTASLHSPVPVSSLGSQAGGRNKPTSGCEKLFLSGRTGMGRVDTALDRFLVHVFFFADFEKKKKICTRNRHFVLSLFQNHVTWWDLEMPGEMELNWAETVSQGLQSVHHKQAGSTMQGCKRHP